MKNHRPPYLSLALLATGVACGVTFTGCTKTDRKEVSATTKDAYEDSKAAMAKA